MLRKWTIFLSLIIVLGLVGCSSDNKTENETTVASTNNVSDKKQEMRTITHLGKEYEIPEKAERIVIVGAMESFEDSLVLDLHPVGASTIGGDFPEVFTDVVKEAEPIGEKTEPNLDIILQLKPDVILVSTKFPDETKEKLKKLAPMVEISHISTDGIENLKTLADITGKKEEAEQAIEEYNQKLAKTKEELSDLEDLNVLAIRIRGGELYVYPDDVFLNLVIYHEFGLPIPDVIKQAKAQEAISLEKLSEVDPDVIFVQNAEAQNEDQLLKDVEDNPIWQSLSAVKEDKVFVNTIDPILEGGPIYSRGLLLDAIKENLGE